MLRAYGRGRIIGVDAPKEALALVREPVAARSLPSAMLTAVGQATSSAKAITGTRGDADETARRLIDLLG